MKKKEITLNIKEITLLSIILGMVAIPMLCAYMKLNTIRQPSKGVKLGKFEIKK